MRLPVEKGETTFKLILRNEIAYFAEENLPKNKLKRWLAIDAKKEQTVKPAFSDSSRTHG